MIRLHPCALSVVEKDYQSIGNLGYLKPNRVILSLCPLNPYFESRLTLVYMALLFHRVTKMATTKWTLLSSLFSKLCSSMKLLNA